MNPVLILPPYLSSVIILSSSLLPRGVKYVTGIKISNTYNIRATPELTKISHESYLKFEILNVRMHVHRTLILLGKPATTRVSLLQHTLEPLLLSK